MSHSETDPLQVEQTSPAADPALQVVDLRYDYDGVPALKGVSLQVAPGELVALMGRNGAGKSTLFDCVVGFLRPEGGTIEVDSELVIGQEAR